MSTAWVRLPSDDYVLVPEPLAKIIADARTTYNAWEPPTNREVLALFIRLAEYEAERQQVEDDS